MQKSVNYPCKIKEAFDDISACYKECIEYIMTLDQSAGKISFTKQGSLGNPSYSLWREEYDYFIDWEDSADNIVRFIDAVSNPYDGAQFLMDGERYILNQGSVYNHEVKIEGHRQPGKIFKLTTSGPLVVAGEGIIIAKEILRHDIGLKCQLKLKKNGYISQQTTY